MVYCIDRLGLFGAYEVLIEIEHPEFFDKSPYKDYDIEEYKEDYMTKNKKKLSKKKYLLSKKK